MNLSKSKYTRFCQCPKMLWLDTYRPELAVQDPALQRRFQEGNEVGDLAMGLLGDFVEATAYTADGKLDIAAMLKNTKKYLIEGKENVCEAAFTKIVRDLLDVFRNGYVYDRAMGGSFSIKKVLPALFPNDPNLDYHNLADVHNGGEATDTYLALRGMEREERDKLRQSLLAYCGLDTLAMVMLWQRLREFCVGK